MYPWAVSLAFLLVGGLFAFTQFETYRIEAEYPPQGQFVTIDGGRIHYTQRRPKGDPRATVVLLHGASGNQADIMTPLGDRLAAKGFLVIAPDRPGHGWSERIRGTAAASPAVQAQLMRKALEAIGIKRAIVVGHSYSGAVAANFALDHADFTQGLVLMAPVTHPWPGGIAWYYPPVATPGLGDVMTHLVTLPTGLAGVPHALEGVFAPRPVPPDYVKTANAYLILRPEEFMANAQEIDILKAFVTQQAPRMPQIKAPTAIITGDHDGVVIARIHSYGSKRDIPGATLDVFEGVGHSPHWAEPDRVVDIIEGVAERAGVAKPEM